MAEPIISFKKLNITFGENVVINNIDLDIRQGETLAVLGPSGSGKSTVLRAMIGLLQTYCRRNLLGGAGKFSG